MTRSYILGFSMKRYKKFFLLILSVILLFALCSCGDKETPEKKEEEEHIAVVTQGAVESKEEISSDIETESAVEVSTETSSGGIETQEEAPRPQKGGILMSGADSEKLKWNEDKSKILSPDAPDYGFSEAPEGYFDSALFIGDSRSVGLAHYGHLSGPHWFVDTGLSIYNFTSSTVDISGVGKVKLTDLFENYCYDKVYIGLGINELGYSLNGIEKHFRDLLEIVNEYEPDATVYLMANIHVTKKRSDSDSIYNNSRLNTINTMLRDLAEENQDDKIYYIDCNPIFDDEDGNLRQDVTFDNTHLLGKYYPDWAEFIRTHVVL